MDPAVCIFCDSEYGDPLLPYHIDKVAALCHLVSKENLVNKKMCMRCKLDIDIVENALRLRDVMVGTLNMKLATANHNKRAGVSETTTRTPPDMSVFMPAAPPALLPVEQVAESVTMNSLETAEPVKEEPLPLNPQVAASPSVAAPPVAAPFTSSSTFFNTPEQSLINSVGFGGYPLPTLTNGTYSNGVSPSPVRTNGRRIPKCHKCNISLKTRPYVDAVKHINKCNGQGVRPGRSSMVPKPDVFPCRLCHRRLASREAHELHITKCDGTNNNTRGRKPADNTCMLCDEDLVYRHILKKHLRQRHGINAQRLDDSVLAALKTGSGTGCNVKEQVLSRIQQKMISDLYEPDKSADIQTEIKAELKDDSQFTNEDSLVEDDETEENKTPPPADKVDNHGSHGNHSNQGNHGNGTRNRRKMKPSKYVPEVYNCPLCSEQFEHQSQYYQHGCFKTQDPTNRYEEAEMGARERGEGLVDTSDEGPLEICDDSPLEICEEGKTHTAMEVENGLAVADV